MWMIVAMLGVVIVLYASMLPRPNRPKPVQEELLDSMGDMLQHVVDEIEDENKQLLRLVGDMKREHESGTRALMLRIEQLERQSAAHRAADPGYPPAARPAFASTPVSASAVSAAPVDDGSAAARTEADVSESVAAPAVRPAGARVAASVKSRFKELFDLHESGKSIDYIAKKLGKNRGEVQLIIGLAKQEEPVDVKS